MTENFNIIVFTTMPNRAVEAQIGKPAFVARIAAAQEAAKADVDTGNKLFALCEVEMMKYFDDLNISWVLDPGAPGNTMGQGRRQVGQSAVDFVRINNLMRPKPVFIWREPEKNMAKFAWDIALPIQSGDNHDIVIPNRYDLSSYPSWSQHWEQLISSLASKIIGQKADYCFGPRGMSLRMMEEYFLRYPREYPSDTPNFPRLPDRHDCIFNPYMAAVKDGLKLCCVNVDFQYPTMQRLAEEDDRETMTKRIRVLNELYNAMDNYDYWLQEKAAQKR